MVEFSQGIRKYISLNSDQEILPIDLVFVKAELDSFKMIQATSSSLLASKKAKTLSFLKTINNKKLSCDQKISSTSTKNHHILKRELIIRYAIAFVLKNRNVISGKEIAQLVDTKFKSENLKSISFDKMTRVINSCIRMNVDDINCEHVSERIHKLILSTVFQFKNNGVSAEEVIQIVSNKLKLVQSDKFGSFEEMQNVLQQSLILNV